MRLAPMQAKTKHPEWDKDAEFELAYFWGLNDFQLYGNHVSPMLFKPEAYPARLLNPIRFPPFFLALEVPLHELRIEPSFAELFIPKNSAMQRNRRMNSLDHKHVERALHPLHRLGAIFTVHNQLSN